MLLFLVVVSLEPFYAQAQSRRRGKSHSDIIPMELVVSIFGIG